MGKVLSLFLIAAIVIPPLVASAEPVTMAWSPVGNPGNAADSTGYGAVNYSYNIGTYDVTASQYVAFLNSNDPTGANTLGLYNTGMSDFGAYGEVIYNSAAANGDKYSVVSGDGNLPINYVNFYDAARFANWVGNGEVPGSTETGAYTLLGGTPQPSNWTDITRNAGATVFIPSQDEWYKAAFYNPATSSYYAYPTSSNTAPTASGPTGMPNSANIDSAYGSLSNVGAYSGTTSPYGGFDMGGNVFQYTEGLVPNEAGLRIDRGSDILNVANVMLSTNPFDASQGGGGAFQGFRLASIATPEPSSGVLATIACAVLWWWRKRLA